MELWSMTLTEPKWIKCDASCPAQAKYLIRSMNGELYFCGHHLNKYKGPIDKWAYETVELDKVEETPKPKQRRRKEVKNG